jgi:thiamine pyrophosphate-dependent acetolactate synthase large subunit-like protein
MADPQRMEGRLSRRGAVARLLAARAQDWLLVTGLGTATYDAAAVADDPLNFYIWGAMGSAAMTGLGLALAQPARRVLVLTGDGEALMGLGALATIAVQNPPNLGIVVLDNGAYGETGGQTSHTARGVDLAAVARGCGWRNAARINGEEALESFVERLGAVESWPFFAAIAVRDDGEERTLPPREGVFLADRFRSALGLPPS